MPEHVPSEVVAAALRETVCGHLDEYGFVACPECEARAALRALATDERVRAVLALAVGLAWEAKRDVIWAPGRNGPDPSVMMDLAADAVLAALCPPDGQDGPETGAGVSGDTAGRVLGP